MGAVPGGIMEGFSEEMGLRRVFKDAPEFNKKEGIRGSSEVRAACTKKGVQA